ncbi:MAG: transposase [Treponema sp.]|nr:transposase [Treponema sp.]
MRELRGCPMREQCTKSKMNRRMEVSKKLLACRKASRSNISNEEGKLLRINRSIPAEGTFGIEKKDYHFRWFMT